MPVREKAVNHIANIITGISLEEFGRPPSKDPRSVVKLATDQVYEQVVLAIDWNRVYHDATARHLSLHRRDADEVTTLVTPSPEALAAAEEEDDYERPFVPPPAWHSFRNEEVCPECIMEAVLANEWGGKDIDKWAAHPVYPRWRMTWMSGKRHPDLKKIVLGLIGYGWATAEQAQPTELDHDGHMPTCVEKGSPRDGIVWVCDPRCPEYNGWAEDVAAKMAAP